LIRKVFDKSIEREEEIWAAQKIGKREGETAGERKRHGPNIFKDTKP
jgi:hypothetical protein